MELLNQENKKMERNRKLRLGAFFGGEKAEQTASKALLNYGIHVHTHLLRTGSTITKQTSRELSKSFDLSSALVR